MYGKVVVLSVNYEYYNRVPWERAIRLMNRPGCVEVVAWSKVQIHKDLFLPKALRLLKNIRRFYGKNVRWTKENMFIRDGYTCQYCGFKGAYNELTIDHVLPESRGGKITWENTVSACVPCNNKKDNKTPSEARMGLRKQPTAPTIMEFVTKKVKLEGLDNVLQELGIGI